MKTLIALAFSATLVQGALTLSPPINPRAGTSATWTVTLSGGTAPSSLQWSFSCNNTIGTVTVTAAGTAITAGKSASAVLSGNTVLTAFNQTTIPDGLIANISVVLPAALANVNLTCTIQGSPPLLPTLGSTPAGNTQAQPANPPVSVSISPNLSFCDINGDGLVNYTDATLERAAVLSQTPADRNGDGKTDVVDYQIVTNAANGLGCAATQ